MKANLEATVGRVTVGKLEVRLCNGSSERSDYRDFYFSDEM